MKRDLILIPYDDSPVARAVLARAGTICASEKTTGIVLAVAALDRAQASAYLDRARAVLETPVVVAVRMVAPARPGAAILALADQLHAEILVPMGARCERPWAGAAVREILRAGHACAVVYLDPAVECVLRPAKEYVDGRHRLGGIVSDLLRGGARLHPRRRAVVGEAAR
jgi:hypothetical protein